MAEFYEVLKRAVGSLPANTGEARRAVYDRARKALIAQLEGFTPPLTPSEITSQRLSLEEAIRKVEGEAARASFGLRNPASVERQEPSLREPAASRAPAPPQTAQPAGPPEPAPRAPAFERAGAAPAETATVTAQRPAATVAAPGAGKKGSSEGSAEPKPDIGAGRPADAAPRETEDAAAPIFADTGNGYQDYPREVRQSRLPLIAGAAAAVLVVIGLSALVYSQRDLLFGGSEAPVEEAAEAPPQVSGQSAEEATDRPSLTESPRQEKSDARIPQGGNMRDVAPGVRTVPTQRVTAPSGADNGALVPSDEGADPTEGPDETATATADGEEAAPQDETTMAARTDATEAPAAQPGGEAGAVAQTAILYEEGATGSGSGQAVRGQVVWSKVSESGVSAVHAEVSIPEKSTNVKISIKPNTEDGFPASHLVEMQFSGSMGSSIRNVPGLILKTTEQAQGDALVGAAIKVTDGLFWIALSAEDKDLARNRKLLEGRGWVDIPLLYASGKRAILTVEKGVPGDDAINTAFKEWQGN